MSKSPFMGIYKKNFLKSLIFCYLYEKNSINEKSNSKNSIFFYFG